MFKSLRISIESDPLPSPVHAKIPLVRDETSGLKIRTTPDPMDLATLLRKDIEAHPDFKSSALPSSRLEPHEEISEAGHHPATPPISVLAQVPRNLSAAPSSPPGGPHSMNPLPPGLQFAKMCAEFRSGAQIPKGIQMDDLNRGLHPQQATPPSGDQSSNPSSGPQSQGLQSPGGQSSPLTSGLQSEELPSAGIP